MATILRTLYALRFTGQNGRLCSQRSIALKRMGDSIFRKRLCGNVSITGLTNSIST